MHLKGVAVFLAALGATVQAAGQPASFYAKSRHVMELDARTFDDFVFDSNHTTIVEFYAPWCGYCQQIKQDFKKAAQLTNGFAQFAAVNCDQDVNKQLCARNNVKGFPTIKTFKPPKKFKPEPERQFQYVQDVYSGERNANRLVDHAKGRMRNLVKKATLSKLDELLTSGKQSILLVTEEQLVPALFKGLAIDFEGNDCPFNYIVANSKNARDKIKDALKVSQKLKGNALMHVSDTGVVTVYDGIFERDDMSEFLAQYLTPMEGPQSERDRIVMGIKSGKIKSFSQYEKMKRQKQRKMAKKASKPVEKDEL